MKRLALGHTPAVVAASLFLVLSACTAPEAPSGDGDRQATGGVDNRVVVTPADQLNLTSEDFDVGWRVSSDGDATQSSVGAVNVQIGLISAAVTDNIHFDVIRSRDLAEARSEMTDRRSEKSASFAIKELNIGDEAFVWGAAGFFEVRFRYRNILGVVSSSASFPYEGSESKARKWAEQLFDKINSVGVLGTPLPVPALTATPTAVDTTPDDSGESVPETSTEVPTRIPNVSDVDAIPLLDSSGTTGQSVSTSTPAPVDDSSDSTSTPIATQVPSINPTPVDAEPTPTATHVAIPTPGIESTDPDLSIGISGGGHSPVYVDPGQSINWNIFVTNNSSGDTESDFAVTAYDLRNPGIPLQTQRVETPNRNQHVNLVFTVATEVGQELSFVVDDLGEIEESNELNNSVTNSKTNLWLRTDLIVESITPRVSPFDDGDVVTWDVVVKNLGPGTGGVAEVLLEVNGGLRTEIGEFVSLGSNETISVEFTRTATAGDVYKIDLDQPAVTDLDSSNNTASVNVSDFILPDLSIGISGGGHSPVYVDPGQSINWNIFVTNNSSGDTESDFAVTAYDLRNPGIPLQTQRVETPNRNQHVNLVFTVATEVGQELSFVVDDLGEIEESNELNNSVTNSKTNLWLRTDLIVESITPRVSPFDDGDVVTWDVVVKNLGPGTGGVAEVLLEVNGGLRTEIGEFVSLGSNETISVEFTRTATAGDVYKIDLDQPAVTDLDSSNNTASVNVSDFIQ